MPLFFQHETLQKARLELGLTQEQAAEALEIDVRTYRRYETGSVNDSENGFNVKRAARRQLLSKIGAEFGLSTEELLAPAGTDQRDFVPVGHVLPPARFFVGRKEELGWLHATLQDSDVRIVSIQGIGGSGKSALAAEYAESVAEPTSATAIWSFYEEPQVERFLRALMRFNAVTPPTSPLALFEELFALLPRLSPQLWILDGLEVLQSTDPTSPRGTFTDPLLRRLLAGVLRFATDLRVLVTTREQLTDLASWEGKGLATLLLGGLDERAQAELLSAFHVRFSKADLTSHLVPWGGHALTVATAASIASAVHNGELAALHSWEPSDSAGDDSMAHRLSHLLQSYSEGLSPSQRKWMTLLSVLPQGGDPADLKDLSSAVTPVEGIIDKDSEAPGERQILQDLCRLERIGLVFRNSESSSRFSCHPFVAGTFKRLLGGRSQAVHDARCTALQARLQASPRTRLAGQQLDLMEEWITHTVLAGRLHQAFSLYQANTGGFRYLGLEKGEMARGLRVVSSFFPDGAPEARPDLDEEKLGILLYDWSLYCSATGETDKALRCLDVYATLAQERPRWATTAARTRAYILRLQGRWEDALASLERALLLAANERDHLARGYALLGALQQDRGLIVESKRAFEKARSYEPELRLRRALWEAEALVDRREFEEARELTKSNLRHCERLAWAGHASHCHVVLGRTWSQEDREQSQRHLQAAWPWANESGEIEAQLRCFELEILLHRDEPTRKRALALAQEAKMGRFVARFERLT